MDTCPPSSQFLMVFLRGSIRGPLLFIIYVNDLPSRVKEAEITMYADATSFYKAFRTAQVLSEELIPAFVKICEWLKMNKLALNVLKNEFMIIGTSQRLNILDQTPETAPYIVSVDGFQIRRVKSVKYLGLIVDDTDMLIIFQQKLIKTLELSNA